MKTSNRDLTAAMDMFNATKNILDFTSGYNLDTFSKDLKTLYAVLHQFLIIGEASKKISNEFKLAHKELEWSKMAKMRDKLIHHYTNVDSVLIWETIKQEIPLLNSQLESVFKKY